MIQSNTNDEKAEPLCPVFNECGGCLYQDVSYEKELAIKHKILVDLLSDSIEMNTQLIEPVVASPKPYHYRNRLDLRLLKTKEQKVFIGFSPKDRFGVVPVEQCPIAEESISKFIPELKVQAIAKLPAKYRLANLVVRTGDDGRVYWGGIGKRSLELSEEDYLWTDIAQKKIYYSLDTFFQANLSILPLLIEKIRLLPIWDKKAILYDLYGGVGFFSLTLGDLADQVHLIENNPASVKLARYNLNINQFEHIKLHLGTVEEHLSNLLEKNKSSKNIVIIDPPRAGLSSDVLSQLSKANHLQDILYLSCNPESLARDLAGFVKEKWQIKQVIPFDFFPKTKHLETLVVMQNE